MRIYEIGMVISLLRICDLYFMQGEYDYIVSSLAAGVIIIILGLVLIVAKKDFAYSGLNAEDES